MNIPPELYKLTRPKQFMRNAIGIEYKTGGATLDGSAFPNGFVKAGTAVYRDSSSGLYKPWNALTESTELGAGLTSHDVEIMPKGNPIVGIVSRGYLEEFRCVGVTDTFKEAVKGRISFDI